MLPIYALTYDSDEYAVGIVDDQKDLLRAFEKIASGKVVCGGPVILARYKDNVLPGNFNGSMLMVDTQRHVTQKDDSFMPYQGRYAHDGILIEDVRQTSQEIGQTYTVALGSVLGNGGKKQLAMGTRWIPPRSNINTLVNVEADEGFIAFYSNPELTSLLKKNAHHITVAQEAASARNVAPAHLGVPRDLATPPHPF